MTLKEAYEVKEITDACTQVIPATHVDRIFYYYQTYIDPTTKNKPIQSLVERYIQLKGVKYVDEIIVYNTEKDLEDLLLCLPLNIRFVGEEYKHQSLTGRTICDKRGIEIYYNKREHSFSTTELRNRLSTAVPMNKGHSEPPPQGQGY